jgi:hypothetical protein
VIRRVFPHSTLQVSYYYFLSGAPLMGCVCVLQLFNQHYQHVQVCAMQRVCCAYYLFHCVIFSYDTHARQSQWQWVYTVVV